MAKSRGRKFAEITSPTSGVFDLTSVPTITNAKLQNSAMTLAGSSVSLGGTGVANTDALSEGSSNLYFTNARVQSFLGGGTLAGNIVVPDNISIYLGSSSDFRLVHNTTNTQLINATGALQVTSNGGFDVTGAATFSSTIAATGAVTANAGVVVDNITIDGTEIDLSSGDLTIDVAGGIVLDADDSGTISFKDDGTRYGVVQKASNNFEILSMISDGDLVIKGNDGGSTVTALTLDMSNAGKAIFNAGADFNNVVDISAGTNLNLSVRQLAFDNFSNEGVGITFSRTSSDADLMAIGVVDTSKLNIASREGIIFSTGGGVQYGATSEVMRIDSSGNVGIGTDSPAQTLHVSSTGATSNGIRISNSEGSFETRVDGGEFYLYDVDDTRIPFLIDTSGNVGIGTTSPAKKLHIFDSTQTNQSVRFGNPAAAPYGEINFNSTGFEHLYIDSHGTTTGYGNIVFRTGATPDARMFIHADGKVGIGTTSPSSYYSKNLVLLTDGDGTGGMTLLSPDTDDSAYICFADGTSGAAKYAGYLGYSHASTENMFLGVGGSTKMTIRSDGLVAIGSNHNPTHSLHVLSTDNKGFLLDRNTGNEPASLNEFSSYYSLSIKNRAGGTYLNFGGGTSGTRIQATDGAGSATAKTITLNPYGGNVGIGTTTPAGLLTIKGTGDALRIESTNTGSGGGQIDVLHHTTSPADNDVHGAINFGGYYSGTTPAYGSAVRSVWKDVSARKGRFKVYTRNGSAFDTRLDITEDGVMINELDNKKFFKLTDEFTASGNSTTNFKINVSDYTGASAGAYCHYTVSVMGYASGGANGLNFKYSVAGYSGHNYSNTNYNSYGAGTIQNGASGSTQYTNVGLSYHPAVNLGGYIANGSVWVYVPAAQQYGVTVVNTHSTGMFCCLVVEGWSI